MSISTISPLPSTTLSSSSNNPTKQPSLLPPSTKRPNFLFPINTCKNSSTQFSKFKNKCIFIVAATSDDFSFVSQTEKLRKVLQKPGIHQGPACFDALSAKLVEKAGFDFCFTSGFSISAARLGLPDTGLISYGEMVEQGQQITQAVLIPVIGDGDNGYGNAMNVKRTVKGYIKAGFAGIILEDQVAPKACGHTSGRKVVSREEAIMRIKAAVDAREESGEDIVIVARTDSRQAVSLEESLWRSRAFADAGADVLFIDALESKEEMRDFCEVYPLVPKMASMLEGGGKTPILDPNELENLGYKLVVYPLSLMGVSIRAMQDALQAIRGGRMPSPGSMPSFDELKEILGFNTYYEEEKKYALHAKRLSVTDPLTRSKDELDLRDGTEQNFRSSEDEVVEMIIPEVYADGANSSSSSAPGIWSRKLRVKITGRDGYEKLDIKIPAGFLEGITNIVPALVGVNMKEMLDDTTIESSGKVLLDFKDTMGDRIQVFLE
ncbi:mutase [Lithospermum erythrorhizon]|uniref:Mutase n=1 Tax=Lithospermum erythrorhizon TaxID=34254 RepID=A0AAV3NJ52_LITER